MGRSMRAVTAICELIVLSTGPIAAGQSGPWMQYADPAQVGFASEKLDEARKLAQEAGTVAAIVIYRGRVLAAWGQVDRRVELHSVRKSLVGALYGIFMRDGKVDVQRTLAELNIDDISPLSAEEKRAKIIDLLGSRSGVYHPAAKEPQDMKSSRPPRGSQAPGTYFWYNNWDFNVLGVVLEQISGQKLFEAFAQRLVRPLGMEDFRVEDGFEELEPRQSKYPAHAFRMTARDLSRVGLLYQQGGSFDGKSIIPESWIKESTTLHSPGQNGGYGLLWWVHPRWAFEDQSRLDEYDKFAARGTGGQFVLVIPDAEPVYVHLADPQVGREVRGTQVWRIIETILGGRTGRGIASPELIPLKPTPFENPPPPPVTFPPRIQIDPAALDAYVGEYVGENKMEVSVYRWQDRLFADLKGEGGAELFPEGKDKFFTRAGAARVQFQPGEGGRMFRVTVEHRSRTMHFSSKEQAQNSTRP